MSLKYPVQNYTSLMCVHILSETWYLSSVRSLKGQFINIGNIKILNYEKYDTVYIYIVSITPFL